MAYRISTLDTPGQQEQAATLYRSVFGYEHPTYGVNPRLLSGLIANGGSVVGALDATDQVVGFAYGFCGTDGQTNYHYSQAAVVLPELQGQGLGRLLKEGQRAVALRHGMSRMRWAYDPAHTRNAHFNLDVLGARGRWFHPDLYGVPGTDRVVVEWDLTDPAPALPPLVAASTVWGRVGGPDDEPWLPLPADIAGLAQTRPGLAGELRQAVRAAFQDLTGRGFVAASCVRVADHTAVYRFQRDAAH